MSLRVFYLLVSVILLGAIQVALFLDIERNYTSKENIEKKARSLYITSPFEEALLEDYQAFWPRLFSESYPLEVQDLPKLYTAAYKRQRELGLSFRDLSLARRWSVLLNSQHKESLRDELYASKNEVPTAFSSALNDSNLSRSSDDCSLLRRERAFRIAQLEEKFFLEAAEFIEGCSSAPSVAAHYLRYLQARRSNDQEKLAAILQDLSSMGVNPGLRFKRFISRELAKVLNFELQHGG